MRASWLLLLLLVFGTAIVPSASAHQRASGSTGGDCVCPPPNDGEAHQHSNPGGACKAAAGASQSATPGGASQSIPGAGVALVLAAPAGVGLVRRG